MEKPRNVLVVANEAVHGTEMTEALVDHLAGMTVRIYLITPALVDSPLDHEMGQIDHAVGPAHERLNTSLDELKKVGIEVTGAVADADPIVAISDELQKFAADEIVLISHTEEDRAYAEKDLLERVNHEFPQPLTQLVVTRPGSAEVDEEGLPSGDDAPHVVGVEHEQGGAGKDTADLEVSENFPPLRVRDLVAIVVGIVGSIALVILAANCATGGDGFTGVCAAKLLIAIGALLINGAHIMALIFFQSLRYEGMLERFASSFTIGATSAAVVVSALL